MLEIVNKLIQVLDDKHIEFCHWKSNYALSAALEGHDDLDLLVGRDNSTRFEEILLALGFKRARPVGSSPLSSIEHFFGHDESSGKLVHLHIYYQILSGENLLKNYRIPFEGSIFNNLMRDQGVPVPRRELELEIFIIRAFLKLGTLTEQVIFRKERNNIKKELAFLVAQSDLTKFKPLIFGVMPQLDKDYFDVCVQTLGEKGLLRWFIMGRKMRRLMKEYRRYGLAKEVLLKYFEFWRRVWARFGPRKRKALSHGGILVAIVGPDATGKSTLSSKVSGWLKDSFTVRRIHVGKPPPGFWNFFPNLLLPLFRWAFKSSRTSVSNGPNESNNKAGLLRAIRLVLLARDRSRLLRKAYRWAGDGSIVVCDRYPSLTFGAMDSPRIRISDHPAKRFIIKKLALIERDLYDAMPRADVLLQLTVDVDLAIKRNQERIKKGSESGDYIRMRHKENIDLCYPCHHRYSVSTNRDLGETLHEIKSTLWQHL